MMDNETREAAIKERFMVFCGVLDGPLSYDEMTHFVVSEIDRAASVDRKAIVREAFGKLGKRLRPIVRNQAVGEMNAILAAYEEEGD